MKSFFLLVLLTLCLKNFMLEILNGSRLVVAILFIENLPSVYEIINLSWF